MTPGTSSTRLELPLRLARKKIPIVIVGVTLTCAVAWCIYRVAKPRAAYMAIGYCIGAGHRAMEAGDYPLAEGRFRAAVLWARALGADPEELSALGELSDVLQIQHKYRESGNAIEQIIIIRERVEGQECRLAMDLAELAEVYEHYRPASECEVVYDRAMAIIEEASANARARRTVMFRYWAFLEGHGRAEEASEIEQQMMARGWPCRSPSSASPGGTP